MPSAPAPGITGEGPDEPFPIEFLAEPAATNLMLHSQDISGWTATAATFGANAAGAPDSTTTADSLIPDDTDTATHGAFRAASAAVASGATVGASVFLKEAGYAVALFRCAPAGEASGFEMRVDLGTGEVLATNDFGAATLAAARLYSLPGGWYGDVHACLDGPILQSSRHHGGRRGQRGDGGR